MELFKIFGVIDIDDGDAKDKLGGVDKAAQRLGDELGKTKTSSEKAGGGFKGMAGKLGEFAGKVGVFKLVDTGLSMITSSVGAAIGRFDTLQNSQKVFENMGFAAEETDTMMQRLVTSVTGLPTPMEDAVVGVQRIVSATGDLEGSEAIYSALNDGVLAFGGSNEQVNSVVEMFSRGLQNGKIDGQQFNSMMSNMGPAINAVGEEMGYTTDELQKGLSDGSISVEEFTEALIDMDVNGGAGMASLDEMARDMTGGIGTSIENVQNAVNRGMASIIEATNDVLESNGFPNISELVQMFGGVMETGMKKAAEFIGIGLDAIMKMVGWVTDNFPEIGETIGTVMDIVKDVISLVIDNVTIIWDIWGETIMSVIKYAFDIVLNTVTTVINAVQDIIQVVTSLIEGDWEGVWSGIKNFFIGIWDGIKGHFESMKSLTTIASNIFDSVKNAIMKPIDIAVGLVSSAIDKIKGFFSGMKLKFPKIKMPKLPKFSLQGKFSLLPPSVPKVGISWNKDGAIFTKPTIFDTAQGRQGVGEAGAEAVLPIEKLSGMMANTMDNLGYGNNAKSGGDIIQNITINTPDATSPSENARLMKNASRQLAMEWGN